MGSADSTITPRIVDPNEVNWNDVIVDLENLLLIHKDTAEVIGFLHVPQYGEYGELARRCRKEVYTWGVKFC